MGLSEQSSNVFVKQVFTWVFFTVEWAFNIYFIPKSSIFSLLSYNNSEIRFSLVLFFCYYIYFKCFWKEEFIKVCLFFKETSCFADAFFFIACFCFVNWLSSMVSRTNVNTKLAVHLYFCFRIICSEIWMQTMQNFFWTWWIQRKVICTVTESRGKNIHVSAIQASPGYFFIFIVKEL